MAAIQARRKALEECHRLPEELAASSDRWRAHQGQAHGHFRTTNRSDTVSQELTIRVPDCRAAYETLMARGAVFLTPPVDWGGEIRCFFRDPDGHLLEISQVT